MKIDTSNRSLEGVKLNSKCEKEYTPAQNIHLCLPRNLLKTVQKTEDQLTCEMGAIFEN